MARTVEEVEALRGLWGALPVTNVDADIDYFLTLVQHDPNVLRPHVVRIRGPQASDALVVCRVVRESYPLRLGYLRLGSLGARTIVVSFDGVVGATTVAVLPEIVRALREALRAGEADAVRFQQVATDDPLHRVVEQAFPRWQRARGRGATVHWTAALPDSWEAFLGQRSSRSRRQIRADDSKFTRRWAGRYEVRRLDLPEHRHLLEPDLERVASRSYQRALGVGTDGSDRQRALMAEAARHGWLRVWMLYLDGCPVAFWWGLAYRGVLTIGSPAFDPDFAKDRVGYFTMRRMIEDLCADPEVTVLDFGHGDADYKSRFGTDTTTSSDLLVVAARPWPLTLNAAVSLTETLASVARRLVERSGRAQSLKRAWRARRAESGRGPLPSPAET